MQQYLKKLARRREGAGCKLSTFGPEHSELNPNNVTSEGLSSHFLSVSAPRNCLTFKWLELSSLRTNSHPMSLENKDLFYITFVNSMSSGPLILEDSHKRVNVDFDCLK